MAKIKLALSLFVVVMFASASLVAADMVIKGTVTDNSGKPVRGALVKAALADRDISRFTQKDGTYQISLPSGSYEVSVDAYGYAVKRQAKDASQAGDLNFALTPRWDVTHLTGAEVRIWSQKPLRGSYSNLLV